MYILGRFKLKSYFRKLKIGDNFLVKAHEVKRLGSNYPSKKQRAHEEILSYSNSFLDLEQRGRCCQWLYMRICYLLLFLSRQFFHQNFYESFTAGSLNFLYQIVGLSGSWIIISWAVGSSGNELKSNIADVIF